MAHVEQVVSAPLYLTPLEHGVPWAGLPQPPAPTLWAFWCAPEAGGCLHVMSGGRPNYDGPDGNGWVEVPRVEHRDGGTT